METKALMVAVDSTQPSAQLVRTQPGRHVDPLPEHTHETSDEIVYVVRGHAMCWMEGCGEVSLEPGTFLRLPGNIRHRVWDVSDDYFVFNAYIPSTHTAPIPHS